MCTLCLSDMGELRDEWLREPMPSPTATVAAREAGKPASPPRAEPGFLPDDQAVAA